MNADLTFQKALFLLECAQHERAESLLREALVKAEAEGDRFTLGQALCCFGEVLIELDRRQEAKPLLIKLISMEGDGLVDHEIERAHVMLGEIDALDRK